jgi:NADH-quinone oxidoreductase subunit N
VIANNFPALTGFVSQLLPEMILGVVACVLFLGSTFRPGRNLWGGVALAGLALAAVALFSSSAPTFDAELARLKGTRDAAAERLKELKADGAKADAVRDQEKEVSSAEAAIREKEAEVKPIVYAAPVQLTRLSLFFKILSLAAGFVLVLIGWNDPDDDHAGEYHGCLLLIIAGTALTGSANELITLFLALELVSIPTYVLLYLARTEEPAQEAAMKYFLLSIFSSALLLFGFSYLYGVTGTTNIPAIVETLASGRRSPDELHVMAGWKGLSLVALVTIVAGLGFRITAVPFHFYAPDVYQGTTTPAAAILAFIPKIVGFAALIKLLGLVPSLLPISGDAREAMGEQLPVLLWIMAAVTMTLGNVLALLQDNVRRMLAYSSVAHAGYLLIGLAVAPRLVPESAGSQSGAVEAVLFYLIAYGAMTVGAFAVLSALETAERRVEKIDDLAGLGKTHPGLALLMLVFLFSLIGIPLTAGFAGKFMLFYEAMGLSASATPDQKGWADQVRLYQGLALIGAINAAIGGWYYLRVAAVMYLREAVEPLPRLRVWPALLCVWVCAFVTLALGVYPVPVIGAIKAAVPRRPAAQAGVAEAPKLAQR